MKPAEVSQPVESGGSVYLLRVNAVHAATVPEFDEVESIVRDEYLSRGREAALAEKLVELWQAADIRFNPRLMDKLAVTTGAYPYQVDVTETLTTGEYPWRKEQ